MKLMVDSYNLIGTKSEYALLHYHDRAGMYLRCLINGYVLGEWSYGALARFSDEDFDKEAKRLVGEFEIILDTPLFKALHES